MTDFDASGNAARPGLLRRLMFPVPPGTRASIGLLVLRIVTGSALVLHGLDKMRDPFSWMGQDSWAPGFLQLLAAVSECFGGLALLIGLLTPLAALGVAATMATGVVSSHILAGDPYVRIPAPQLDAAQPLLDLPEWLVLRGGSGGAWEHATLYLAIAILLLVAGPGPGRIAIDALFAPRGR